MSLSKEDEKTLAELQMFLRDYSKAHEEGGDYPDPLDLDRLWKVFINVASTSAMQRFAQIFPYISFYNSIVPEFSTNVPEFVQESIEKIKNFGNVTIIENKIKPFIRVLPFLTIELCIQVFELSINVLSHHLRQHPDQIPPPFLITFEDVVVEDFNIETFSGVVEYFKEMLESDFRKEVLFIFSHFAVDIVRINQDHEQFVKKAIMSALEPDSENMLVIAGFYLLNQYSIQFQFEPESAPPTDFLFTAIFPRLTADNSEISKSAHHAAEAMITCRIFQDYEAMQHILSLFDNYQVKQMDSFFSLLHVILYPVNDYQDVDVKPEMKKLIPIRSFIFDKLNNRTEPIIKAHCINVISDFMSIEKSFAKNCYQKAWEEAKKLITNKTTSTYHLISTFLLGMYMNFDKQAEVLSFIPTLATVLSRDKPLTTKQRLDLAVDIASICSNEKKPPQAIETVLKMAQSSIGSKYPSESLRACCIIQELIRYLNKKSIKTIFEKLYSLAKSAKDKKSLDFYTRTMRMMISHYPIPSNAQFNFLTDILRMDIPIIQGESLGKMPEFIKYACTITKCYKNVGPQIFETFDSILGHSPIPEKAPYLIPIIEAVHTKQIKKEDIDKFWDKRLKKILAKGNHPSCINSVCAAMEALKAIYDDMPSSLDPLSEKIDAVSEYLKDVDVEEQLIDVIVPKLEVVPSACDFIIDVYANSLTIDINDDILSTLFNLMPFPAEVTQNESIIKNLMVMMMREKYQHLRVKIARLLAGYLLLNKKDLDEFKFEPKLISQMTYNLKIVANEKPENFDKILKHFQNKTRDVPKLQDLLK